MIKKISLVSLGCAKNLVDSEILVGRNTVAECYQKVLTDLNDAETQITNTTLTKASKNAAIAFKTRVYLHMRDWDNVIFEGNKLNGLYTLTASPNGPFIDSYSNTESAETLGIISHHYTEFDGLVSFLQKNLDW